MDWMTIFERFGPLGIAVLYFVRKEVHLVTAAKTLLTDIGAITATATYNGSALISKGARATERRK